MQKFMYSKSAPSFIFHIIIERGKNEIIKGYLNIAENIVS